MAISLQLHVYRRFARPCHRADKTGTGRYLNDHIKKSAKNSPNGYLVATENMSNAAGPACSSGTNVTIIGMMLASLLAIFQIHRTRSHKLLNAAVSRKTRAVAPSAIQANGFGLRT